MKKLCTWLRDTSFWETICAIIVSTASICLIIWAIYDFLNIPGKHPALFWTSFAITAISLFIWLYLSGRNNNEQTSSSLLRRIASFVFYAFLSTISVFVLASIVAGLVASMLGGDFSEAYNDCPAGIPIQYC